MIDDPDDGRTERPMHLSAEDARGGEIILRSRARRWIFVAGLIAIIVLAVLIRWSG